MDNDRSTPIMVASSTLILGRQETMGEAGQDNSNGRDKPVRVPLSGESPTAHGTSPQFPAWPGPRMGQAPTPDMSIAFPAWSRPGSSLGTAPGSSSTLLVWPWPDSGQFIWSPIQHITHRLLGLLMLHGSIRVPT